jgi:hypothetical protein
LKGRVFVIDGVRAGVVLRVAAARQLRRDAGLTQARRYASAAAAAGLDIAKT